MCPWVAQYITDLLLVAYCGRSLNHVVLYKLVFHRTFFLIVIVTHSQLFILMQYGKCTWGELSYAMKWKKMSVKKK